MEEQGEVNVRLQRGNEAAYYKLDGSGREFWSEESWWVRKHRGLRLRKFSSPGGLETRLYCHPGRWIGRRRQLANLQRQFWKWYSLLPRGGIQGEGWAPERDLEGNWFCHRFQAHPQAYRGSIRFTMVKIRERQPSRRGPSRGSSSRTPAADEHHHCCCCYCHRRARATPLPIRQFVEVGSSSEGKPELPSFGSVVFTLPSTEDNAGVNAHISILFTKIPEGGEDENPQGSQEKQLEGPGKEIDTGEQSAAEKDTAVVPPASEAGSLGETSLQDRFPPVGPPPPGVDEEKWRKMWEGRAEGDGWAYVVEDKSLYEEADAHLAALLPSSARLQD